VVNNPCSFDVSSAVQVEYGWEEKARRAGTLGKTARGRARVYLAHCGTAVLTGAFEHGTRFGGRHGG